MEWPPRKTIQLVSFFCFRGPKVGFIPRFPTYRTSASKPSAQPSAKTPPSEAVSGSSTQVLSDVPLEAAGQARNAENSIDCVFVLFGCVFFLF